MQVPFENGGSNKRSGPDTPIEEAATLTRHDDIKKTKRKGKEAATSLMWSVNLDSFNSSFEEHVSQRNELGECMLNLSFGEFEVEMYLKIRDEFNNNFNLTYGIYLKWATFIDAINAPQTHK